MFSDNHKISLRQMQALFCFYFLGTASLFLPAELAEGSGRACWLVMLIGGLLAAFFSLVLTYLGKKEPTWTVVEWLRNTFGGVLGSVLAVLIAGKIAVDAMLEVRIFTEILRSTMLPHTPLWLMVGTLLALSAFGVARGIEGQARGAEILFFFVFPPFVLLLFAVALTAGEAYFLPVQLPKLDGLRRGAAYVQPLFQAMIFLLFLPPFLEKPEKGQKSLFAVCLLTTFLMTAATFLCLTVYGAESLSHKIFPTVQVMERVRFSGIFLGRQDILLLWFWMVSAFLYVSGALFFGSVCCVRLCRQTGQGRRYWLLLWVPLLFFGAMIPQDLAAAYDFRNKIQPIFSALTTALLPLLVLGVRIVKERGKRRETA